MKHHWLVLVFVLAATAPLANAVIVSATAVAADPTVSVVGSNWDGQNLDITENVRGHPATVLATFTTDPPVGDPSAWIRKRVDNNTTFAWAGYIIDITMRDLFSINSVVAMPNWTGVASPVLSNDNGTPGNPADDFFAATINFTTTTPGSYVQVGGTGQFNVLVTFPGTASFGINQTPVAPEPISLALLALGGLLIRRTRR